MSQTYRTVAGDTFATIARKFYGTEEGTLWIRGANTGVYEPIPAGTSVTVPDLPTRPKDQPQSLLSGEPNEVAIGLGDVRRFRNWESVTIERSLDRADTVKLLAPFDPADPAQRELFKPFSYSPLTCAVGGVELFNGTTMHVTPRLTQDARTVFITGYARSGVLNDCTLPAGASGKTTFEGQTLGEIAKALCGYFGLSPEFIGSPPAAPAVQQPEPIGSPFGGDLWSTFRVVRDQPRTSTTGAPFPRNTRIKQDQKVMDFLARLAQQRGYVIGSASNGNPLFRIPVLSDRVATFEEGKAPVVDVFPNFNPQGYFSEVTAIKGSTAAVTSGAAYTVRNPHLRGTLRPLVSPMGDTLEGDVTQAAFAAAGRMFANMASYNVLVSHWRNDRGELWAPGMAVELYAPGAFVYRPFPFTVRSVRFYKDARREEAELNLVLPGTFAGEIPRVLPWQ